MNLRPALHQHLRQRLQAFSEGFRQNLALIGPPGSGKTFQLQQLAASAPERLLVISCPLYRESCRSFLQRFLGAILEAGLTSASGISGPAAQPATLSLEQWLGRAEAVFPRTVAAMRPIEGLLTRRLYGEAFNRTLETIPRLIEERGRPCVLILDEFLYLEELGFHHAFHELGKRVMTWPSTLFVLSSSSAYRAKLILRERLQLLFGQFELLTLETLDPAIADAWANQELAQIAGASEAIPFLIHWLGSYPWYLAVLLKRLKELAALQHRATLSEALFLQAAWDVLGSREGMLHQWCLSCTETLSTNRLGARALEALLQMAKGAKTPTAIGQAIGRAGLSDALQVLLEHDLAQRKGMCWIITNPALRCWLSTILTLQRTEARWDDAAARRQFDGELRGMWQTWSHRQRQPLAEQVARLFTQFADETISLDAKTGRLPKFDSVQTASADPDRQSAYLIASGDGKRWCATVHDGPVDEQAISRFEMFCRSQSPKPSRKIIITTAPMDAHATLLAKAAKMWIWEPDDLNILRGIYGQP